MRKRFPGWPIERVRFLEKVLLSKKIFFHNESSWRVLLRRNFEKMKRKTWKFPQFFEKKFKLIWKIAWKRLPQMKQQVKVQFLVCRASNLIYETFRMYLSKEYHFFTTFKVTKIKKPNIRFDEKFHISFIEEKAPQKTVITSTLWIEILVCSLMPRKCFPLAVLLCYNYHFGQKIV